VREVTPSQVDRQHGRVMLEGDSPRSERECGSWLIPVFVIALVLDVETRQSLTLLPDPLPSGLALSRSDAPMRS
jgi:hypothetical protein